MSMPNSGSACLGICTGCQIPYLGSHLLPDHQFVNALLVLDCTTAQTDEEADGCYRSTEHEKGLLVHDGTRILAGHEPRASCNDATPRGAG